LEKCNKIISAFADQRSHVHCNEQRYHASISQTSSQNQELSWRNDEAMKNEALAVAESLTLAAPNVSIIFI
jgi:hypothetical protein